MSYHFRPILTPFDARGTAASYFLEACRTEFLMEPTDTTY